MIYLDNAATTFPKPERVYDVMDKMNRQGAVNAGRGAYRLAKEATKLIDDTKKLIRQLIHVDITTEVVFSPSITVAMNQIVNGLRLKDRAVIYLSPYEHNAVARSVYNLGLRTRPTISDLNSSVSVSVSTFESDGHVSPVLLSSAVLWLSNSCNKCSFNALVASTSC